VRRVDRLRHTPSGGRAAPTASLAVAVDPRFTHAEAADFTLTPNSPAVNKGVHLGAEYRMGLSPRSSWPDRVLTLNQDNYGPWEIGAFVYAGDSQEPR
jgi:hypothetical protein